MQKQGETTVAERGRLFHLWLPLSQNEYFWFGTFLKMDISNLTFLNSRISNLILLNSTMSKKGRTYISNLIIHN